MKREIRDLRFLNYSYKRFLFLKDEIKGYIIFYEMDWIRRNNMENICIN